MASFLFCPVSEPGDLYPSLAIAVTLQARGHQVAFLTAPDCAAELTAAGVAFLARPGGVYGTEMPLERPGALLSMARLQCELVAIEAAYASFPSDVVVDGAFPFGPRLFSERHGIPRATLCAGCFPIPTSDPLFPHGPGQLPPDDAGGRSLARLAILLQTESLAADVAEWDAARASLGLSPSGRHPWFSAPSTDLVLLATSTALEYPRSDLPPQFWFIGPLPWRPHDATVPDYVASLPADLPVVYVSQGGTYNGQLVLLHLAIAALRDAPYRVLGTTVRSFDADDFAPLPGNVILEQFIPLAAIAGELAVVITHGGLGTVQTALSHGVPLIVMPFTADQFEIAARCVWAGVGIRLDPRSCNAGDLRDGIATILADPGYRTRAERVGASHAEMGGADTSASLLERLAATRQAVLRPPSGADPWAERRCA